MSNPWKNGVSMPDFESLDGNVHTDVLIIGGGIAGILCAYMLEQAGVDYILAEGGKICSGITGNTTAKITAQHGLIYDGLIRRFGTEKAGMYLDANQRALERYRRLAQNFDCDFEENDSFIYSADDPDKLEKEVKALEKLGYPAEIVQSLPLPFETAGAVVFRDQAQISPMKLVSGMSAGLNIFENTAVRELHGKTAVTDRGTIRAEKIIVATHFPLLNRHGSYFIKMYQHRSYVIALEDAQNVKGMYADEAPDGLSFRNYGKLLLLGGGGHRTGKKGGSWRELRTFAEAYYPDAKEKYRWAAQDCMTLDSVPYVGQYSARTGDLFVTTGFNKWGMTSSMAAAMLLCNLVQDKSDPSADVFSPSRSILRPQLAVNALESVGGMLSFSQKRCPHLGCALKWNPDEHSWDCPCHGSRFSEDGRLIDNPAMENINRFRRF